MKWIKKILGSNKPRFSGEDLKDIAEVLAEESTSVKSIYLSGWELSIDGSNHFYDFLKTQRVESFTQFSRTTIEIVLHDNHVYEAYDISEGQKIAKNVESKNMFIDHLKYPIRKILNFKVEDNGLHQLGGKKPDGFNISSNLKNSSLQYLGHIDNVNLMDWLPFKLHLVSPIYTDFENIYFDYDDPVNPIVLNLNETNSAETIFDFIDKNTLIEFSKVKFNLFEAINPTLELHAGVPDFLQYPAFPKCPKSGNLMRFVCQLYGGVSVNHSNISEEVLASHDLLSMNFWEDGNLYVFMEPEFKTVCYFIQNT